MKRVMVDIETLGTDPGAADLSNDDAHHALGDAKHQADVADVNLENYRDHVPMRQPTEVDK